MGQIRKPESIPSPTTNTHGDWAELHQHWVAQKLGHAGVRWISPQSCWVKTHGYCRAGTNSLATLRNLGGQINIQPFWYQDAWGLVLTG